MVCPFFSAQQSGREQMISSPSEQICLPALELDANNINSFPKISILLYKKQWIQLNSLDGCSRVTPGNVLVLLDDVWVVLLATIKSNYNSYIRLIVFYMYV